MFVPKSSPTDKKRVVAKCISIAAQRLNPNVGHFEIGTLLFHVGMIDQALRALQRAIEIDPTNAAYHSEVVNGLMFNTRYQDAIAAAEKLSPRPRGWLMANVGGGDVAEARRHLTEERARNPKDDLLSGLNAQLLAREGKFREAEAALTTPTEAQQRNRNYHHGTYLRACVYALGGNADRSVEWMRETVENGMPNYPAFSRDACFDSIRHTTVFTKFISELRPTWESYERALR